jgi:hypothetical protein
MLGNIVPKPSFEDFHDKPSRSPNFSLQIRKASVVEHIAHVIILSIYFVELELHDKKVCLHTYVRV